MSQEYVKEMKDFVLPPSVVSKADLSHLVSEVERLDNELTAASVREKAGASSQEQPKPSEMLGDFLAANELELSDSHSRSQLVKQLRQLKDTVPVIHMTFAVSADYESMQQIAQWLRSSVNPQAVLAVGLQPSLIGGVYLRTPNHIQDLSVKAKLSGRRNLLVEELEVLRGGR